MGSRSSGLRTRRALRSPGERSDHLTSFGRRASPGFTSPRLSTACREAISTEPLCRTMLPVPMAATARGELVMLQSMRSLAARRADRAAGPCGPCSARRRLPPLPVPAADPASPRPAGGAPRPRPTKQTGLAPGSALVGNTIDGQVGRRQSFAEYFDAGAAPSNTSTRTALSTGTWAVTGNKVCFDFPDDDDRSCPNFEVTGNSRDAMWTTTARRSVSRSCRATARACSALPLGVSCGPCPADWCRARNPATARPCRRRRCGRPCR